MIEKYLIALVLIPCAAVALSSLGVKIKAIVNPQDWHKVRMRPIDCAFCMAFWINIGYQPWSITPWHEILLIAFASAVIAGKVEQL